MIYRILLIWLILYILTISDYLSRYLIQRNGEIKTISDS